MARFALPMKSGKLRRIARARLEILDKIVSVEERVDREHPDDPGTVTLIITGWYE
jgi:hypothetical protein